MPEGNRLSTRSRQTQRTLEAYLASGAPPRWMERLMTVENGIRREKRRLAEAYEEMRGDPERWRRYVELQRFDELNRLIRQHNEYFPIERDLPFDPRTGEYLPIHGRSHRRPELDAAWVLEHFPASS